MKQYLCEYYLTDGSCWTTSIYARYLDEAQYTANQLNLKILGEVIWEIDYE